MKKIICFGIAFVLISSFNSFSSADIRSDIEFNLNIGNWIVNPTQYIGLVEIAYTGDQNTSIILNRLEMSDPRSILWEANISKELKGTGDDYYTYMKAIETYRSGVRRGLSQTALKEAYETIENLNSKISRSLHKIRVPIDPNRIFLENEFIPGNKKEITFTLKLSNEQGAYEITKKLTIEIREPLPRPPLPEYQIITNMDVQSSGWFYGDLHIHSTYTDCDSPSDGDQTITERKARAQSIGMNWLSITDHSYCFDSYSEWNTMYLECVNNTDSSFVILPSEELSVSEDCSNGNDDEILCQRTPYVCTGDAGHLGAHSLTSFIQNIWGSCPYPYGSSGRCPAYPSSQEGIYLANSQGFSIINHPISDIWDWESINCVSGETGIEIWNGEWDNYDSSVLDLWVDMLLDGQKIYAYGGGDVENTGFPIYGPDLGVVYNGVYVSSLTQNGLTSALKQGHLFITNYPAITINGYTDSSGWKMMGDEVNLIQGNPAHIQVQYDMGSQSGILFIFQGKIGNNSESQYASYSVSGFGYKDIYVSPSSDSYYRAYVVTNNGTYRAYTNPIWVNVVSDTTPPDTTITSWPSGTITYDDVTFTWTGTDNVTSTSNLVYSYYLQGYDSGWSSYTSATSKSYNNLPNGTYTFQVRAKDQAGNVDPTPDTKTFTVNITPSDTTPPDTTITSWPSGTITYDDVTFTWTGTDNVTSTSNLVYSYYLQGYDSGWSSYTSATSKSYNNLPNGTYTFQVRAKDQAGNVDPTPDTKTFTVQISSSDIQFTSYFLDDVYYGNGDSIANPGELIELSVVLENTGTQTAYDVTATATTTSPYINYFCAYPPYLTPFFGDIPGGGIGVGYMYFMVSNAPDGTTITFNLTITDSSGNTWYDSFDIVVTGTDTLPPRSVGLQVSPQLLNVGNTVTIMALVEEGDDMSFGSVMAQIETSNKAVVTTIILYDDGAHNDLGAGDGVYGGSWITTLPETDYLVSILTSDRSGNAAEWNDLAGFTTKTFTVSNKILVVDDDNHNLNSWVTAAPYQSYYTAALYANGLPYDVWEHFFRGSPPSSILIEYDVVIWLTGDTYGASYFPQGYYVETLSSTDQTNLITYLEGGGNLFICGQDIGYDLNGGDPNDESFYSNYLHAAFVQDRTNLFGLYGVTGNPMTDGLYFLISGGDSANNQYFASEIDPINGAITILTYDPNATLALQQSIIQKTRGPFEREGDIQPLTSQLLQGIISSGSGAISVDTGTYKVIYFAFGLEAIDNPADRNIIMRKMIHWLQGTEEGSLPQLFDANSYLVVGDDAYSTDVLGTAKISYGLALGGASKNPEGRTHTLLTGVEHDTGNLIIVGGPAVSPVAKEFGNIFNIEYNYVPGVSFKISWGDESIFLDLARYPQEDICIIYLGEHNGRNVLIVWGYGWEGSYAGSAFIGDPANWQEYEGANMLMLRWTDINSDGLVQMPEIIVEAYEQPLTAQTAIRGVVNLLRGIADWVLSLLFNANSYFVVGDEAYCTDVLGTAKISYGLAQGGSSENPEGRTDVILTQTEHDTGNLIIVGGPAVSPVAKEFGNIFNIEYNYVPGVSFKISWGDESIFLDLARYPQEDICIIYLGEHNGRNVLIVWGYGWEGSYAGSIFAGDPETWQTYADAHMFMLRWIDSNSDGLVQESEIIVEAYA